MNLPNQLTLSRIFMIPIFVVLLEIARPDLSPGARTALCLAASVIYILAAITDIVDGMLARRWDMITDFGKLFDPLADKLLATAALVIFVQRGLFSAWVVVVILCREFIVTGLRSLGGRHGRTIAADRWGKAKTISQTIAILYCLGHLTVMNAVELSPAWSQRWSGNLAPWSGWALDTLIGLCLLATVISGVTYLWTNWDLVSEHHHT